MQILAVLLKQVPKMHTPLTGSKISQEISNCTAVIYLHNTGYEKS
jgi:hypothetical protein